MLPYLSVIMSEASCFAVIPARGGSKGVKRKNLRHLNGTSLVELAVNYGLENSVFKKVLLTTEEPEIAKLFISSQKFQNCEENKILQVTDKLYIHKRYSFEAQDLSPIRSALHSIVDSTVFSGFEHLMLLQPSSPFRFRGEVEEILKIAMERPFTSVVSVRDATSSHPERMFKLDNGVNQLVPYLQTTLGDNPPRQLLDKVFIKDGAFYFLKTEIIGKNQLLGDRIVPYDRSTLPNVNIDNEDDMLMAELLAKHLTK